MSVRRVALAVALGVSAFVVGTLSDAMLGAARSPTPPATYFVMAGYLALCQFAVATKGVGLRANAATVLGMAAPWLLVFITNVTSGRGDTNMSQELPLVLAGSFGPVVGAIVAGAYRPGRART